VVVAVVDTAVPEVKTAAVAALDPRVAVVPAGPEELDDADEEEPATPMVTPLLLLLSGDRIPCILALCRFKSICCKTLFGRDRNILPD